MANRATNTAKNSMLALWGVLSHAGQREDHKPLLFRLVSHSDPVFDQRIQGGLHTLSHVRKAITARRRTKKAPTSPTTLLQGTEPPIPLDKTTKSTVQSTGCNQICLGEAPTNLLMLTHSGWDALS